MSLNEAIFKMFNRRRVRGVVINYIDGELELIPDVMGIDGMFLVDALGSTGFWHRDIVTEDFQDLSDGERGIILGGKVEVIRGGRVEMVYDSFEGNYTIRGCRVV